MTYPLYIVTGAPGAGKSSAVKAFVGLAKEYIAFDIDWLAVPASNLCGKDIFTDASTWPAYNQLWFEVLRCVYRNGLTPVLFAPISPEDVGEEDLPRWCRGVEWALLDCDDATRRRRLTERPDWDDTMSAYAMEDAGLLRRAVSRRINTALKDPAAVAEEILRWLEQSRAKVF